MIRRVPFTAAASAALACAALAVTALASGAGAADAAPPASTSGKTYVALGDSYAAGYGIPATKTNQPVPGCDQTVADYPHLLATELGLTLTDVTCSGAITDNITTTPQQTNNGTAPLQIDAVKSAQPDLVTITIGGNDLGFISIAENCIAASPVGPIAAHPTYTSCQAYYDDSGPGGGKAGNPYDKLAAVTAKVQATIAAVQAAAPNAKIAVIAYPAIAPDSANTPATGCFAALAIPGGLVPSALPFTDADIPYLQVLQQRLDAGIGQAAAAAGASYADIYPSSLSHSACQPESTRWVEPVVPGDPPGTNVLHPNLAGTTAMAAALSPVVQALFPTATTSPTPTPTASTSTGTTGTPSAGTSGTTGSGVGGVSASAGTSATPRLSAAASRLSGDPLAQTGTRFPIGWTLVAAAVLLLGGVLTLRFAGRAAHRR